MGMLLTILGVLTTWGLWCHVLFNITHTIHRDTDKTRMTSKKTKKTKERNRLDNRGNREEERVNRHDYNYYDYHDRQYSNLSYRLACTAGAAFFFPYLVSISSRIFLPNSASALAKFLIALSCIKSWAAHR